MTEFYLKDRFFITGLQLAMIMQDLKGMAEFLEEVDIDPDCDMAKEIIEKIIKEQRIECYSEKR